MFENLSDPSFWYRLVEQMIQWSIAVLPKLLLLVILYFVAKKMIRVIIRTIQTRLKIKYEKEEDKEGEKRITTLLNIVRGSFIVFISVIFIFIFLKLLGLDIAPLLAGAGIVGLAIGFGAQELVRDVISGFFMLLENQLRVGDVVKINGTGGLVEKIELRTIVLRDLEGVVHVFQNGKINTLSNLTMEWSAAVFEIGVAYKENLDVVIKVIQQTGDGLSGDTDFKDLILEPIEIFGLERFGESEIVIKARLKTKPSQQWFIGREFRKRLKLAFDQNKIEIPFPHRTIYWGEEINPLSLKMEKDTSKSAE